MPSIDDTYQGAFSDNATATTPSSASSNLPVPVQSSTDAPQHLQPVPATTSSAPALQAPLFASVPAFPAPGRPLVGARTRAGIGLLFVAGSTAVGAWAGGGFGAGAGLAFSAAVRNLLRAKRSLGVDQTEAVRSGTVAVVGLGAGAWLAYEAWKRAHGGGEEED